MRNPVVLFTHAHIDHMGGIAHHVATRSLMKMKPPTYVMPKAVVGAVENLLDAFRALDGSELPATLVGLSPGSRYPLGNAALLGPFARFIPFTAKGMRSWNCVNV